MRLYLPPHPEGVPVLWHGLLIKQRCDSPAVRISAKIGKILRNLLRIMLNVLWQIRRNSVEKLIYVEEV